MIWYEIVLPVYKQGSDLSACLQQCDGNVTGALRKQAARYRDAALALEQLSSHRRSDELKIAADTHSITVEGPTDLLEELAAEGLIVQHEDDESTAVIEKRDDGWHYCDGNYPEEGYCGPYESKDEAIAAACEGGYSGYVVEGEDEEDQAQ